MPADLLVNMPDGQQVRIVRKGTGESRSLLHWWDEHVPLKLWDAQRQIIEAVEKHDKVAVATCHGLGKTFVAAGAAQSWLHTRTPSYVVTTAPSSDQVKKLLWKEIRALWNALPNELQDKGECMTTHIKMYRPGTRQFDPHHYAYGRATDTPGRFQGQHAQHLFVIVDEAAEVDDEMFGIIDTFGAEKELLIGNPTRPSGRFYRAFKEPGLGYHCIKIRASQTPNFTGEAEGLPSYVLKQMISPERVKQWALDWGVDSAWYRSRVDAEFPEEGAEDVLVPQIWFTEAMNRTADEAKWPDCQIGVDVAHFGTDTMAVAVRVNARLVALFSYPGKTSTQDIIQYVRKHVDMVMARYGPRNLTVLLDRSGVGAGVADLLQPTSGNGIIYKGIAFSETPRDSARFANSRAEMYWELRERFQPGGVGVPIVVDLPPEKARILQGQLSTIHYAFNDRQKVQIESKEQMRQRGLASPDESDAVALAFAPYAQPPLIIQLPNIGTMLPGISAIRRL